MSVIKTITKKSWSAVKWAGTKLFKIVRVFSKENTKGIYIDALSWNFVVRPVLSLVGGLLYSSLVVGSLGLLGLAVGYHSTALLTGLFMLASIAFAILIGLSDTGGEKIPNAHAALITFFGKRFRVYRTEGDYSWEGKALFLDRSREVLEPGTNKEGYLNLGEITFQVWNSSEWVTEDGRLNYRLSNLARNSAMVYTTITLTLKFFDPFLWFDTDDPATKFGERARSALRTAISFFIDTEVVHIKTVLGKLMTGKTIVTAFLKTEADGKPPHSMLTDIGGDYQYLVVDDDTEDVGQTEQDFARMIDEGSSHFASEVLEAVRDSSGNIWVEVRSVDDALDEVANQIGAKIESASISDVQTSEIVFNAANAASSEQFQRSAQLASARAVRDSRNILIPTEDEIANPGFTMAQALAAAQDNEGVTITHVSGDGDRLSKAAVAGAQQLKKGGK